MPTATDSKFLLQDGQYNFPYHYIPHYDEKNRSGVRLRRLGWGLEYLCYIRHVARLVSELCPQSVLDVGCGDGRFLGMLPPSIPRKVGCDLSSRAIAFARAFNPDLEFHDSDVSTLHEQFELVTAIEVLEHVPDDLAASFLADLGQRVLPAGRMLVCVPTTVARLQKKHWRHYNLDLLLQQVREANLPFQLLDAQHIFRHPLSFWTRLLLLLGQNPWWTFDTAPLRRVLWNRIWRQERMATPQTGKHLVALFSRKD